TAVPCRSEHRRRGRPHGAQARADPAGHWQPAGVLAATHHHPGRGRRTAAAPAADARRHGERGPTHNGVRLVVLSAAPALSEGEGKDLVTFRRTNRVAIGMGSFAALRMTNAMFA